MPFSKCVLISIVTILTVWSQASVLFSLLQYNYSGYPAHLLILGVWAVVGAVAAAVGVRIARKHTDNGKLALIVAFSALGTLALWLAKPHERDAVITGAITNAETGGPVPGATIRLIRPAGHKFGLFLPYLYPTKDIAVAQGAQIIAKASSGADGYFKLGYPAESFVRHVRAGYSEGITPLLKITAAGYETTDILGLDALSQRQFKLKPIPPARPQPVATADGAVTLAFAHLHGVDDKWNVKMNVHNHTSATQYLGIQTNTIAAAIIGGGAISVPQVYTLQPGESNYVQALRYPILSKRPLYVTVDIARLKGPELHHQGSQVFLPHDAEYLLQHKMEIEEPGRLSETLNAAASTGTEDRTTSTDIARLSQVETLQPIDASPENSGGSLPHFQLLEPSARAVAPIWMILSVALVVLFVSLFIYLVATALRGRRESGSAAVSRNGCLAAIGCAVGLLILCILALFFFSVVASVAVPALVRHNNADNSNTPPAVPAESFPISSPSQEVTLTSARLNAAGERWTITVKATNNTSVTQYIGLESSITADPDYEDDSPSYQDNIHDGDEAVSGMFKLDRIPLKPGQNNEVLVFEDSLFRKRPLDVHLKFLYPPSGKIPGSKMPPGSVLMMEKKLRIGRNAEKLELLVPEVQVSSRVLSSEEASKALRRHFLPRSQKHSGLIGGLNNAWEQLWDTSNKPAKLPNPHPSILGDDLAQYDHNVNIDPDTGDAIITFKGPGTEGMQPVTISEFFSVASDIAEDMNSTAPTIARNEPTMSTDDSQTSASDPKLTLLSSLGPTANIKYNRGESASNYQDQLAAIKETLTSGTSEKRNEVLNLIMHKRLAPKMDDSYITAFAEAAKDTDPRVRRYVARIAGERWVWNATVQNPQILVLMMDLSEDEDPQVRHFAVYFGLSGVRPMMEGIVRRMLEIAIQDRELNIYQRIVKALKNHQELTKQVLHKHFFISDKDTAAAMEIYYDITGEELPSATFPSSHSLHLDQDIMEDLSPSDIPAASGYVFDSEASYDFSEGNYYNIDLGGYLTSPTQHILGDTVSDAGPVLYLSPLQKRVGPLSYSCMRVLRLADEAWTTFTASELQKQCHNLLGGVASLSSSDALTPGVYVFQTEINLGILQVLDAQLPDGPGMRIRIKRVLLPLEILETTALVPPVTNGIWEFTSTNEVEFSQANYLNLDLGLFRKNGVGFLSQLQLSSNGPSVYRSPYQGNHQALSYAQLRISRVDDELWTASAADALQKMQHALLENSFIYGTATLTTGTYVFRTELNAGLLQVAESSLGALPDLKVRYKKLYRPLCRGREEPPQELKYLGLK